MVMPKGYRETELGCIPIGWEVTPLEQISDIRTGPFGSVLHASDYVFLGTPIITVEHLGERGITKNNLPRVSDSDKKRLNKYTLNVGDIVFSRVGSIDRNAYITENENGWLFSGRLLRIRPFPNSIYSKYLSYYFKQSTTISRIESISVGQTMASLNTQLMNQFQVVLPTLVEQNAIATALSDVDELIDSLESLIAKKKAIKQGAMQELLVGRKRLPGYDKKFEVTTLGNLLTIAHGKYQGNVECRYGKYPILATGGVIGRTDMFLYDRESVLIGRKGTINRPFYMNTPFWTIDTLFYTVISDDVYAKFIYYLFCSINWELYNEASGVPSLSAKTISNIVVKIPDINEQKAIAKILSDMDIEIEILTKKLSKSRQIKQGMMQELLTGHIRLLEVAAPKQKKAKTAKAPMLETAPKSHNEHFHEAVILSTVVSLFASEQFPLGRFRRQKFAYLLHRHAQESTQGFLKKAAGPYNPTIRYKDEQIAIKSNYVAEHGKGKFVQGKKSSEAVNYFVQWYGSESIEWLKQFQYVKSDDLEVLTTVAEAIVDLKKDGTTITVESVKEIIRGNSEWRPKLDKDCFSDFKIQAAIKESQKLFA